MEKIIIKDKIYGKATINSPAIIELISSKPLQRLKKINQFGLPNRYYHVKNYSRYDHSIGVFMILRKLNASEEEQIAGLLHDVSHTAFSHVVDWVFDEGAIEDFQNQKHKEFIEKSTLPKILKKYRYDPGRISEHKHFKLLEQNIPDLCADRIDYFLRELPVKIAREYFKNLLHKNGKIVFNNKSAAKKFAENFLDKQNNHWGGFEAVSRYEILSRALKIGLKGKIISFNDFWGEDEQVLEKLEKSKNLTIKKILKILKNKNLDHLVKSNDIRHKKFRYIDPKYLSKNKILKLSENDKRYKIKIENARKINNQGILIPQI